MNDLGHQDLPYLAHNAFPSDHAPFMWSLGFALMALRLLRR